jgi:hypothetical protein
VADIVTDHPEDLPPFLHLAGGKVKCCGGWLLMLSADNLKYQCPCGKNQNALAVKILRSMGFKTGGNPDHGCDS